MDKKIKETAYREHDLEEYRQGEGAIMVLNHAADAAYANAIMPSVRKAMIVERDRLRERQAVLWNLLTKPI